MPDQLDAAQQLEEMLREQALQNRQPTLPANGRCYNCQATVAAGQQFCDADCRDDYTARERAKRFRKIID